MQASFKKKENSLCKEGSPGKGWGIEQVCKEWGCEGVGWVVYSKEAACAAASAAVQRPVQWSDGKGHQRGTKALFSKKKSFL
jgi:hypothetical protein